MTRIDLITGFLGSGKTTFLKQYVHYLLEKGERIAILEFDYGAVNVDMMLLQEFNDTCDLEMVAGGCDYDCHLRRFRTKLIAMGMKKYDRVIVEPSGVFDPDEFFDTLYEDPLDQWYEIGSVISIVDAGLSKNLSDESEYILVSQLAASGEIILSKTQNHTDKEISDTISCLRKSCADYKVCIEDERISRKPFSSFTDADYEKVIHASYLNQPHVKKEIIQENSYSSVYFMNAGITREKLKNTADLLFNDESYGKIIRIKGFLREDGKWFEFNRTKEEISLQEIPMGQDVVIVIGENLNEEKIKSLYSETEK